MKSIRKYALALLGSAVLAFGMYNIHAQSNITEGGILGLGLLFRRWFGVSPAVTTAVLSAACYFFGFRVLGKNFVLMSAVSCAVEINDRAVASTSSGTALAPRPYRAAVALVKICCLV